MASTLTVPRRGFFRARVLNHEFVARQAEQVSTEPGTLSVGEARVLVAAFGIPDTHRPVGVRKRQVIDQGAFGPWLRARDFETRPMPFYLDHGDAMLHGWMRSTLKVGRAEDFAETKQGLEFTGLYNLRTQIGHDAFQQLAFDPRGTQFSFRWTDEETVSGDDGFDHVVRFDDLIEVSQVSEAAQEEAGLVGELTARAREEGRPSLEDMAKWIGDDDDFATNLARLMPVHLRAVSLGDVQRRVILAWYDQQGDDDSMRYPEDVVIEDGNGMRGYVVVSWDDGEYRKVSWSDKKSEGLRFDMESMETVRKVWAGRAVEGEPDPAEQIPEGEPAEPKTPESPEGEPEPETEDGEEAEGEKAREADPIVSFYSTVWHDRRERAGADAG